MGLSRNKETKMLLVGVWANRNWILGNWLKEVRIRSNRDFDIRWIPFIYAGKRSVEKFIKFPIPKRKSYFFSYITIFEHYLKSNPMKFHENCIVLYPHNESEMGDLSHQANILNQAYKTYFFCKADADQLKEYGLSTEKIDVALCAVDDDCVYDAREPKSAKTVILASRFGPRKGLEILPEVVRSLPDFRFVALGRDWDNFIKESGLGREENFEHHQFNKASRNKYFSQAGIFLSLSNLEGGPVPLIEAIAMGCVPVATKTGFAPDLISQGDKGVILPISPTLSEVCAALDLASKMKPEPILGFLTWDRITQMMIRDKRAIEGAKRSSLNL